MMLSGSSFAITVEADELNHVDSILKLYKDMHAYFDTTYFYIKEANEKHIVLDTCHKDSTASSKEKYPLDVLLPIIKFKMKELPRIEDPYSGYDGTSVAAYSIEASYHGLEIKRVYLYAGK